MADGTRSRGFDERLGVLEGKFGTLLDEVKKDRMEKATKFDEIALQIGELGIQMSKSNDKFEELKQLILQNQGTTKPLDEHGDMGSSTKVSQPPPSSLPSNGEVIEPTINLNSVVTSTQPMFPSTINPGSYVSPPSGMNSTTTQPFTQPYGTNVVTPYVPPYYSTIASTTSYPYATMGTQNGPNPPTPQLYVTPPIPPQQFNQTPYNHPSHNPPPYSPHSHFNNVQNWNFQSLMVLTPGDG